MEEDINHPENQHFPEDPEAPKTAHKRSFKISDLLLFGIISLLTLMTIFFSVYIIAVKYF